jgi:hypothetical protein
MLFWLNGVFLVWPAKRWAVPVIIVSFYFWAGMLKLNYEWLSGSVLYADLWLIPSRFAWLACTYVVILELLLIWGLLATNPWWFWSSLAQLAAFHIESLSQIHWFYPALMSTVLAWFVLYRRERPSPSGSLLVEFFTLRARKPAYVLAAAFALFQLAPFAYRGDRALTGQGRVLALHMFEARQLCEVFAVVHSHDDHQKKIALRLEHLPPRVISARDGEVQSIDFLMKVKRKTELTFRTIVDETDFCRKQHEYLVFGNNRWILY